jgi:beta-glucosidase
LSTDGDQVLISSPQGSAFGFPWADKATTVMQTWFGGNETGEPKRLCLPALCHRCLYLCDPGRAIADVVFGKVNPSGRLPLSFPKQIEDCTAHLNWQAENGVVNYGEGIFVSGALEQCLIRCF